MQTAQVFEFPVSAYVLLAIAFFGLGTGYLIFGPQGITGFSGTGRASRSRKRLVGRVDAGILPVRHRMLGHVSHLRNRAQSEQRHTSATVKFLLRTGSFFVEG